MSINNTTIWNPEIAWKYNLRKRNKPACIGILQKEGWNLLNKYLNGGLGNQWWLFPVKLGTSNVLKKMSVALTVKWKMFTCCFGEPDHVWKKSDDCNVASVLCMHYQSIELLLDKYLKKKDICISQNKESKISHKNFTLRMINDLEKLQPLLLSYWFHGSVGSNEIKPFWSDLDGLAIVSKTTFLAPENLAKLRLGLIKSKSYMVDFMPYQLHGHFVLTEIDLISYPSCMFPSILFKNAQCIVANSTHLLLCERFDRIMSLEMLWEHGINDIISIPDGGLNNTLKKIAFLHRVFLLPCLIFQTRGKPYFKKDAFDHLDMILLPNEIATFELATKIWSTWESPHILSRLICHIAKPFRFNPLLYQKVSHEVGKRLQWFSQDDSVDWPRLVQEMRMVASNVWNRESNKFEADDA